MHHRHIYHLQPIITAYNDNIIPFPWFENLYWVIELDQWRCFKSYPLYQIFFGSLESVIGKNIYWKHTVLYWKHCRNWEPGDMFFLLVNCVLVVNHVFRLFFVFIRLFSFANSQTTEYRTSEFSSVYRVRIYV